MYYRATWLAAALAAWGIALPLLPSASGQTAVTRLPPVDGSASLFVKHASFGHLDDCTSADIRRRMAHLEADWETFLRRRDAEIAPHGSASPSLARNSERGGRCELYAGGAIVVMKARFENGAEKDDQGEVFDFNMRVVPRVWLGYWNPRDNGLRARFWQYADHSSTTPYEPATPDEPVRFMRLDAGTVDIDTLQRLNLAGWHLAVGVGARYAWLEQRVAVVDADAFAFKRFSGIGPVVAVDMRRPFGNCGLSWVANLGGSLLVGHSRWRDPGDAFNTDDIGSIAEMQIGLEWRTPVGERSELVVCGYYEQQVWFGAGTYFPAEAPDHQFTSELRARSHDVAFMGFVASVELIR